jgi:hypothetical protein
VDNLFGVDARDSFDKLTEDFKVLSAVGRGSGLDVFLQVFAGTELHLDEKVHAQVSCAALLHSHQRVLTIKIVSVGDLVVLGVVLLLGLSTL